MKIVKVLTVILLIYACNKSDSPSGSATTSLRITIKDSNDQLLSGADVKLYLTEADLHSGLNQIGLTTTTDNSGTVLFDSLQPVKYFFFAQKGCINNQRSVFPIKTFDSTLVPLIALQENSASTQLLSSGSIKYVNYSGNAYALTWTEKANNDIPGGEFLTNLNNNDSLSFPYEAVGEYKTKVAQLGGSYNNIRTDTVICGGALVIHLP